MKNCLFMFILLFEITNSYTQSITFPNKYDSTIIRIKDFYKGYGKILYNPEDILKGFNLAEQEIAISLNDIIQAENLFFDNYNECNQKCPRTKNVTVSLFVENPKKHFRYYYRQYFGFKNKSDDRFIVIHLMNFKQYRKAKDAFKGWKDTFAMGLGDFYCKNERMFIVNLTNKEVFIQ